MTEGNSTISFIHAPDEEEWMDIGEALKSFYSKENITKTNEQSLTNGKDRQDRRCCLSSEEEATCNYEVGVSEPQHTNCNQDGSPDLVTFKTDSILEHRQTTDHELESISSVLEDDKNLESLVEYINKNEQSKSTIQNQNIDIQYDINRIMLYEEQEQESTTAESETKPDKISATCPLSCNKSETKEMTKIPDQIKDLSDVLTYINSRGNDKTVKNDLNNLVEFITPQEERIHTQSNDIEYTVEIDQLNLVPSEIQIENGENRQEECFGTKCTNKSISEFISSNKKSEPEIHLEPSTENQVPVSKSVESSTMFENTLLNNSTTKQSPTLRQLLSTDYNRSAVRNKVQPGTIASDNDNGHVSYALSSTNNENKQRTKSTECLTMLKNTNANKSTAPILRKYPITDFNNATRRLDKMRPITKADGKFGNHALNDLSSTNNENKLQTEKHKKMTLRTRRGKPNYNENKEEGENEIESDDSYCPSENENLSSEDDSDNNKSHHSGTKILTSGSAGQRISYKVIEKTLESSTNDTQDNGNVTDNKNFNSTNGFSHEDLTSNSKFKCDLCPKSFDRMYALWSHKRNIHRIDSVAFNTNGTVLSQQDAESSCIDSTAMNNSEKENAIKEAHTENVTQNEHMQTHNVQHPSEEMIHSERKYKCEICSKMFSRNWHLLRHKRNGHNGRYLRNRKNNTLQTIDNEIVYEKCGYSMTCNNLNLSCNICKKTFSKRNYFKRHIDTIHLGVRYTCGICQKSFSRKENLKIHTCALMVETNKSKELQIVEQLPKTDYNTSPNGNSSSKNKNLSSCIDSTTMNNSEVENTITETHTETATQNEHKQTNIARRPSKLTHSCDICQKVYKSHNSLRYHKETVHSEIKYKCEICSKMFGRNCHLLRHKRNVHNGKEYLRNTSNNTVQPINKETVYEKCGYSNKEHENCSSLNLSCNICKKIFSKRCYFKRHIDTIHLGVRYTCGICKKSFSRKDNLKIHMCALMLETNGKELQNVVQLPSTDSSTCTSTEASPRQKNVTKNLTFESNIRHNRNFNKRNLIRHQHTNYSSKNRHKCNLCFRSYTRIYDLWYHKRNNHRIRSAVKANGINGTNIRSFTCGICLKVFRSIEDCKDHCKMQHNKLIEKPLLLNKPVQNDKSTESTTTVLYCQSASIRDWEEFNQKDPRYLCEVCGAVFADRPSERKHIIKMHLEPNNFPLYQLQCNHCQQMFPSYKQCHSHYMVSHVPGPYKPKLVRVQECENRLVFNNSYHVSRPDEVFCQTDKALDSVNSSLSEQSEIIKSKHERISVDVTDERNEDVQDDNVFLEKNTVSTVSEESDLLKTKISNENKQETPENRLIHGCMIQCSICDLVCFSYKQMQKHHKINHQDKPFRFSLLVKDNLKTGAVQSTTKEQSKECVPIYIPKESKTCPYCKKSFLRLKSEHLIKCKTFSLHCKVCGKGFHCKEDLELHVPIHHTIGGKEVKCHICNKKLVDNAGRLRHAREMHYGKRTKKTTKKKAPRKQLTPEEEKAKKVVCDICGKVLKHKYHLPDHMKIHTGEKMYQCDICGYTCTRSDNLITHKRMHTGDKPYKCDQCGKQFARGDNMKTHIRKMHQ